jgi:hypothetical protein
MPKNNEINLFSFGFRNRTPVPDSRLKNTNTQMGFKVKGSNLSRE